MLNHIFHEFLRFSLSKGMVIVSTIPGPQYKHSAARILSIYAFLFLSSAYYFSTVRVPPSSSFFVFQMLRAFIMENPPVLSLTCF